MAPLGGVRFLTVGEALIDLVQSREDGRFVAHPGGSSYNVAITLGRLGADVAYAGQCGADGLGAQLTDKLATSGVRLGAWRMLREPTSLAVAELDEHGQAGYVFYFGGTAGLSFAPEAVPQNVDVVHAGSIASWLPSSAPSILQILRRARDTGQAVVSYDPNVRPTLIVDRGAARAAVERCVACAHVVKASEEDIEFLYGATDLASVASSWCAIGAALVVVTRGAAGAVAFAAGGLVAQCPAPAITVEDTVGAGDSLMGGLLAALAADGLAEPAMLAAAVSGADPRIDAALHTAVTVAAITCERPGADPPTALELAAGPVTLRSAI